jgi:ribose/xylose/arabinose/galactoside ABC-type transport system permease subunit
MAIAPAIRRPGTREAALLAACILTAAVFASASPYFLTAGNLATIARNSVELLMIALGMTLVIATGGIDISVGAAMGVCAIAVGTALDAGWPAAAAAALGPVGGMALGLITAAIVVRGGVPPIIATLGLFGIWRAAVYLLLGGRWISGLPDDLGVLVRSSILGLPTVAFEILALYLLAWLVLRRTPLGTWWLAIGGNETAARLSGVQVVLAKSAVYAASGFCVGLAATVYVAQYRNVEMTIGGTVALDAIVAAVLGGAAVAGGRASLAGTALGVVLVRILQNGFVLVGVPSLWEQVVIGALLLGVLALERVSILRLGARPA